MAELNLLTTIAGHSTRRPTDAHDEHSTSLIADADGEPDGAMRLTFGADVPASHTWPPGGVGWGSASGCDGLSGTELKRIAAKIIAREGQKAFR